MSAPPAHSSFAIRRFAVGLAGFVVFMNLYSPQAILPLLATEFSVTAAEIASLMTASTIAVAIVAPLVGAAADVIGRKVVIVSAVVILAVPTFMIGMADSLHAVLVWRFVQGLVLPPIFAVTIAYVGEEWPPAESALATATYVSGASLGSMAGRIFTGVMADTFGWRASYVVLAAVTLAGGALIAKVLPLETKFVRTAHILASLKQMVAHFRNMRLVATFYIGAIVAFSQIACFTFINFHLAAPPFFLSPSALGAIFLVFLFGIVAAPLFGGLVSRFGRRATMLALIATWLGGYALTLIPSLPVIFLGLIMIGIGGIVGQALSTSDLTTTARTGRSSAVGLYATFFYVGGGGGAALGGIAWSFGEWPACVALICTMVVSMALVVFFAWREPPATANAR